jgi:hypothetical protein
MVRRKTSLAQTQRGAALIIVVAIMTILLAIALTFFSITRLEVQTATNVVNAVRSDLLNDAGNAIAMAQLNQDLFAHPAATSNDFAFRSLFNGTWAAGKRWAWRDGVPIHGGGVPQVNWYDIQRRIGQALGEPNFFLYAYFPKDDYRELLYMGPRTRPWLFVPRWQGDAFLLFDPTVELRGPDDTVYVTMNPQGPNCVDSRRLPPGIVTFAYADCSANAANEFPYVTTEYYGRVKVDPANGFPYTPFPLPNNEIAGTFADGEQYPQEQIDAFTDVDNDGDGLRDSIWLPIPKDVLFTQDGVDNNLDGRVDEANEAGTFVYWGGDDGLDNDGNGLVDDPGEQKYFLTSPLPGLRLPVDIDGDGISGDKLTDDGEALMVQIPNQIYVPTYQPDPLTGTLVPNGPPVRLTDADVDVLDNDYDLIGNDFQAYVYIPNSDSSIKSAQENREYNRIKWRSPNAPPDTGIVMDLRYVKPTGEIIPDTVVGVPIEQVILTLSGEPVCHLAGRMAVLVRDTSSLLNLNIAGGHHYEPRFDGVPPDARNGGNANTGIVRTFRRSLNEGVGTWELDTRILPNVGPARAAVMWTYLTGRTTDDPQGGEDYIWDILTPGYGRTDDNGNAILLALNHADDDGDGFIDNGFLPALGSLSPLAQEVIKGQLEIDDVPNDIREQILDDVQKFAKSYDRLGALEGIDEPSELQRVRPLRNWIAEGIAPRLAENPAALDTRDNDADGLTNEIGELGDKQLQAESDIQRAPGIGEGIFNDIKNYVTVHSLTKNVRYIPTDKGLRGLNRLNYNYATPQQIAVGLLVGGNLRPITQEPDPFRLHDKDYRDSRFVGKPELLGATEPTFTLPKTTNSATGLANAEVYFDYTVGGADTNAFADGLRQAMVHIRAPQGFLYGPAKLDPNDTTVFPAPTAFEFPADPVLEALQAAASIVDFRDEDHARSVITTDVGDKNNPSALDPRQVVPLDQLLSLADVDEWLQNIMGATAKTYEIVDRWWQALTGEQRRISYSVAGVESIRINEIMVRPVRRVEAETLANRNLFPLPTGFTVEDPVVTKVNSGWPETNFDPSPLTQLINNAPVPILPTLNVYRNARKITGTANPPFGINLPCTAPDAAFRCDGDFIGDRTVLPSVSASPTGVNKRDRAGVIHVPAGHIVEFVIRQPYIAALGSDWAQQPPSALPPGRYYLLANINLGDESGNSFRYSVKYVSVNDDNDLNAQTILGDYCALQDPAQRFAFLSNYFQRPVPAYRGPVPADADLLNGLPAESRGKPAGEGFRLWFLDGTPQFTHLPDLPAENENFYFLDQAGDGTFGTPASGNPPTHTVHAPQALRFALCIAIYAEVDLDIDYFDFSQEPDHEWVEIVNISDEPVDISGWKLEIGAPDVKGQPNPEKSVWKIPANTEPIPPGGVYLLAFNVFDAFATPNAGTDATISLNGLGLARGSNGSSPYDVSNVCTPPIPPRTLPGDEIIPSPIEDGDPTRSVFDRADSVMDFVDINGDSIPDQETVPLAWSRIIQLECEQWRRWDPSDPLSRILRIDGIKENEENEENNAVNPDAVPSDPLYRNNLLADLILRGGVFPNYPEHDWVDNDGDNGILTADAVDNNLDYPIRVTNGVDDDGDNLIDEPGEGIDELGEGIDEGRGLQNYAGWRIGGAGSFGWGSLPVGIATGGGGSPWVLGANPWVPGGEAYYLGMEGGDPCDDTAYGDPPDWKAFVERRWYPGDAVIVTLYTNDGRVADRVTYTEQDVINRAIDDIAPSPYRAAGFAGDNGMGPTNPDDGNPCNIVCLHPGYTTFWLPNHMALDFYKSLERRSPFFTGDRFGTTNRWEATDGNYDDWAENPGWLLRRVDVEQRDPGLFTVDRSEGDYFVVSNLQTETGWNSNDIEHLYQHARDASPLRMNFAHRLAANPDDQFTQATEFTAILGKDRATLENKYWTLENKYWNFNPEYAHVQNHSLMSAGDLMRMPHEVHEYFLFSRAGRIQDLDYRMDPSGVNTIVKNEAPRGLNQAMGQNLHLRSVVFGQDENYQIRYAKRKDDERYFYTPQVLYGNLRNGEPLRELAEPGFERPNLFVEAAEHFAPESVTLTVGQADFIPIRPNPYEFNRSNSKLQPPPNTDLDDFYGLLNWNGTQAPAAFVPIYLYALTDDVPPYLPPYADGSRADIISPNATIPLRYVFNRDFLFLKDGPFNPLMPATSDPDGILAPRNPLERRAVAYVAERRYSTPGQTMDLCGFGRDRAEALFVWDAEDGLENGEYLVYIGTVPNGFAQAYADTREALQNIGIDLSEQGIGGQTLSPPPPNRPYFDEGAGILASITPDIVAPLAVEIITDPPRTRRMAPSNLNTEEGEGEGEGEGCTLGTADPSNETGLTHPDYWNGTKYQPRSDGYIYYGGNTASAWKPFLVRVKDNFLALRIRNLGEPGQKAVLTHVVLTPRKYVPGKININTVENYVHREYEQNQYKYSLVNVLTALPGLLRKDPEADVSYDVSFPLNSTTQTNVPLPSPDNLINANPDVGNAANLSRTIMRLRPDRGDGRYYEKIGELVLDALGKPGEEANQLEYPLSAEQEPGESEQKPGERFAKVYDRFRRIANLITTRSDIFEVLVTVQSGYGRDMNQDGKINYRSPEEFIVTGETKSRMVYERRTPSDRSDQRE